jgi:hypothetical protein
MNTDSYKSLYDFCERAYVETPERRAFNVPEWIDGLKSDRLQARKTHLSLQAILVSILNRGGEVDRHLDLENSNGRAEVGFLDSCTNLRAIAAEEENADLLMPVMAQLAQYLRFTGGLEAVRQYAYMLPAVDPLHRLATEAAGRNAAGITPVDIVDFMIGLSGKSQVDAYALDGIGILYGGAPGKTVKLVGDEFKNSEVFKLPEVLATVFDESKVWFRPAEFTNRACIELENLFFGTGQRSDALLVNAARLDLPFYPTASEEDEELDASAGLLNKCLTAGYSKVVVLVSNHYLTAGRGRAKRILDHCLKFGLQQVIQLPMGVMGVRSQSHSILVFENSPNKASVEFIDLSDEKNTRTATKGFGLPRRAKELKIDAGEISGTGHSVEIAALLDRGLIKGKARKIVSFEVGQFVQDDPLLPLRGAYEFMRLQEFMEVFRSHHIVETGDAQRTQYYEIGANEITDEGWIKLGKLNDRPLESLQRRKAQILRKNDLILCFRGSPDSYGKVAIYQASTVPVAVPNQSFVILRHKPDAPVNAPSARLVLWWLKSGYAQEYLRQKAISPDVMRVAPRDVAALEVPCGPQALIDLESEKIDRAEEAAIKIQEMQTTIADLRQKAWQLGHELK